MNRVVTLRNGWRVVRVTEAEPCRVCRKPDWCCHVEGGGGLCQRVPSPRRIGDAGWFHPDPSGAEPVQFERREKPPAYAAMLQYHQRDRTAMNRDRMRDLVVSTGIDAGALRAMGVGWNEPHGAYSFPMRDGDGRIVGLRLRNLEGRKWAVPGSRTGLFLCEQEFVKDQPVDIYLPEGPTDSAVLVELGFTVWGRPDARSGAAHAKHRLTRLRTIGTLVRNVVVIGDDDSAGITGARTFAETLASSAPLGVRVVMPPSGLDTREWVDLGASKKMIEAFAASAEVIHA